MIGRDEEGDERCLCSVGHPDHVRMSEPPTGDAPHSSTASFRSGYALPNIDDSMLGRATNGRVLGTHQPIWPFTRYLIVTRNWCRTARHGVGQLHCGADTGVTILR